MICPVCNVDFARLGKHMNASHKEILEAQKKLAIDLYLTGLSSDKIAKHEEIWLSKTTIVRLINDNFSKEEIENRRVSSIKQTLKTDYASGKHDSIKEMNAERVKTEEARKKNSNGVKASYKNRMTWNFGLTKETSEKLLIASEKIKTSMRIRYENGLIHSAFKEIINDGKDDADPILILKSIYGGEIIQEDSVLKINEELFIYVIPLTKKFSSFKYLATDLRNKYKNILIFFYDEWIQKREIVLSMINNKLNKNNKIYARKCEIKNVDYVTATEFFKQNHLSGSPKDISNSVGLYYEDKLACVLSMRKPRNKKYMEYLEIARFASILNTSIIGGFSKLLKHILKINKNIMTYADLRIGNGEVYSINGFEYVGKTEPDYFYSNGFKRESRLKYKAKDGLTEKEVAADNNVWKIFGAGSNIFIL